MQLTTASNINLMSTILQEIIFFNVRIVRTLSITLQLYQFHQFAIFMLHKLSKCFQCVHSSVQKLNGPFLSKAQLLGCNSLLRLSLCLFYSILISILIV